MVMMPPMPKGDAEQQLADLRQYLRIVAKEINDLEKKADKNKKGDK